MSTKKVTYAYIFLLLASSFPTSLIAQGYQSGSKFSKSGHVNAYR